MARSSSPLWTPKAKRATRPNWISRGRHSAPARRSRSRRSCSLSAEAWHLSRFGQWHRVTPQGEPDMLASMTHCGKFPSVLFLVRKGTIIAAPLYAYSCELTYIVPQRTVALFASPTWTSMVYCSPSTPPSPSLATSMACYSPPSRSRSRSSRATSVAMALMGTFVSH